MWGCKAVPKKGMSKIEDFQEQLSERVKGNFLLHLFINDVKFLITAIILTPIAICGVMLIPKVWEVSPEDFKPKIKISGLDFLQAKTLAKTAREHESQGDYEAALYSWNVALSNHPTNTENLRSAISAFLEIERPSPKQVSQNINYSIWLLRLNQTNFSDLEIIAETFDRSRLDQLQYSLLNPHEEKLTEPMRAAYSRTLFNLFKHEEFNSQWQQLSQATRSEPNNALYGSAYAALWGTPAESERNLSELNAVAKNNPTDRRSRQLLLLIHFQKKNAIDYHETLSELREQRNDSYSHHLGYWTLLFQLGDSRQSLKLATNYDKPPTNANDLITHLNLLRKLGEPQAANVLVKQNIQSFGGDTSLYSNYADLLIELNDWDHLREIAINLRKLNTESRANALSYYLEGTADAKQKRRNSADTAFEKFANSISKEDLQSEDNVARELTQLGFPKHALRLLTQVESKYVEDPKYWYSRVGCAFRVRDYSDMRHASEKAFKLDPNNSNYKSALAESLLLLREDPARAVRLTLELMSENPNSFSHHINHVIALTINQRVEDAAALFNRIRFDSAPDAQARAAYHYAHFGIAFLQNDYQEAYQISKLITDSLLSNQEREWFMTCREIISDQIL